MKRRIITPAAKRGLYVDKDEFQMLVAHQLAGFLIAAEEWRDVYQANLITGGPHWDSQMKYLQSVGFALGDHVKMMAKGYDLYGETSEASPYEHVKLLVIGAYSLAYPTKALSGYAKLGDRQAAVYVRVQLDMPPLEPLQRWVPSARLQLKRVWKNTL